MKMENNVIEIESVQERRLTDKLLLPSSTPEELIDEEGESVDWLVEDVIARGAVTDFNGPAKKGGKTTFFLHAIAAGAQGEDIADFDTQPARYLYLSEQGNNIKLALEDAGLDKAPYSNYIRVVQYKAVADRKWKDLISNAAQDVITLGFDGLVVDTVAKFGKLRGAEENEAGPVGERMQHLTLVTQTRTHLINTPPATNDRSPFSVPATMRV